MKFDTKKEACQVWVSQFNAIPMGVIEKLMQLKPWNDYDDYGINEITPPCLYDHVTIFDGEWGDTGGEIIETCVNGDEDLYLVRLDGTGEEVVIEKDYFDVDRDDFLPMWGTMWAFEDSIDNYWLSGEFGTNGLQKMANCGFRIYEQEDYGYIFGIDGAGYDFYEEHWIPLYDARGLKWHKTAEDEE